MRARHHAVRFSVVVCAGVLLVAPSSAHIDLLSPPPRASGAPDSTLDESPCGQRDRGRVLEKVSVFRPGETIAVTWDVYVQHPSYFRLAFDLDGDDSFSERSSAPADPALDVPGELVPGEGELILGYVEDRAGQMDHVEQRITLPRQACDNCTLQLTQFIYGVPLRDATYYQCADITLGGEAVEPDSDGSASPPENGCALGVTPISDATSSPALLFLSLCWLGRRRRRGPPSAARRWSAET